MLSGELSIHVAPVSKHDVGRRTAGAVVFVLAAFALAGAAQVPNLRRRPAGAVLAGTDPAAGMRLRDQQPHSRDQGTLGWECARGRAHGTGTLTLTWDGNTQTSTGRLQDGKETGQWVVRRPGGSVWRNGQWVGLPNGPVLEGSYVDGQRHGSWISREPDGRVEDIRYDSVQIVGRRMYASSRDRANALRRRSSGGESAPAGRGCEIPGYPRPSNVRGLGLAWRSSGVSIQRRAFALQAAGAWCAIAGGTSSTPAQVRARHQEINAACDRLAAIAIQWVVRRRGPRTAGPA